jgi:hypothetical protein
LPQLQTPSTSSAVPPATYKTRIQPSDKSSRAQILVGTYEQLNAHEMPLRPELRTGKHPRRCPLIVTKQLPPKLTPLRRASVKPKTIRKKVPEILYPTSNVAFVERRS